MVCPQHLIQVASLGFARSYAPAVWAYWPNRTYCRESIMTISAEWSWIVDLIAEQGRTVTVTKAQGLATPAKPWRGNASQVAPIAALPVEAVLARYSAKELDGDKVLRTDQKALVAPPEDDENLLEYDRLVDTDGDGRTWRIVHVDKIEPGSEILLYILQLRR